MPAPLTIHQAIAAGSQFNELEPTTTPTTDEDTGVKSYPESAQGGLFEFDFSSYWLMEIQRIIVASGNAATVNVYIVTAAGQKYLVYTGASPGTVVITDLFKLAADEKISIETVGATLAMTARVTGRPIVAKP